MKKHSSFPMSAGLISRLLSKQMQGLMSGLILVTSLALVQLPATCADTDAVRKIAQAGDLLDYGDPNFKSFVAKLGKTATQPVHILQFGDSHTAADIFSGQLRLRFQEEFGDGGIGLIPPGAFSSIRQDNVRIRADRDAWQLFSTRNPEGRALALGGYLAFPSVGGATLTLSNRKEEVPLPPYRLSLLYQSGQSNQIHLSNGRSFSLNSSEGRWSLSAPIESVQLPLSLTIQNRDDFALGALYFTAQNNKGVIYSALGVNGATQMDWSKWTSDWPQTLRTLAPDMIVLAYGTNEATHTTLDPGEYRVMLTQTIHAIREAAPNATILLLGAPDSMRAPKKGLRQRKPDCTAQRPPALAHVISIQREVARRERILYWGWQDFMGGYCAMHTWNKNGLARDDLVHFQVEGYRSSANALYQALQALGRLR